MSAKLFNANAPKKPLRCTRCRKRAHRRRAVRLLGDVVHILCLTREEASTLVFARSGAGRRAVERAFARLKAKKNT